MQKNSFVNKNCVITDLKKEKKKILLSQFFKVGKTKGSIFFQSVCEAAILHILNIAFYILGQTEKMATSFSCCGKEEKDDVWETGSFSDYSSRVRYSLTWD